MGRYVEAEAWLVSETGYGRRSYRAYCPHRLGGWAPAFGADAMVAVTLADRALRGISAMPKTDLGGSLAGWMMARDESIRSSVIEGVESTGDALAWARYRDQAGQPVSEENDGLTLGASKQVAAAVQLGEEMSDGHVCTTGDILRIHALLFESTRDRGMGGVLRDEPIWVGPAGCRIDEASFVAPPPDYVPGLMDDLAEYLNSTSQPAAVQAAVAHAQFETIHPFEDGNGRTGRALMHAVLNARGLAHGAVPISTALERDRTRYYRSLNATRVECDADDGAVRSRALGEWMQFFADACADAQSQAAVTVRFVEGLAAEWERKASFRSDSAASALLGVLPSMPITDAEMAAERLGVSMRVARLALQSLAGVGIVRPTGGRRNVRYEVPEMVTTLRRMNPDGSLPAAPQADPSPPPFTACTHRGPRSQRNCVLPRGHAGQHRYE